MYTSFPFNTSIFAEEPFRLRDELCCKLSTVAMDPEAAEDLDVHGHEAEAASNEL